MSKAKNLATFGDNVDSSGNITDLNVDSNTLVVDTVNNRVGIGESLPTELLHITSASSNAKIVLESGVNTTSNGIEWVDESGNTQTTFYYGHANNRQDLNVNGNGLQIYSKQVSAVVAKFGINASANYTDSYFAGNVGIGTSSPSKELHVYRNDTNTAAQVLIEQEGTGDASIGFLRTGVYNWMTGIDNTDNKYKISGSGAGLDTNNYLAIDTSGNVGIGTSSPSAPLDVAGNIFISADTTESVRLTIGNGRSGDGYSYVDLVGDATYTEYGLRMIRNNTGANATSDIYHRGTGALRITAQDAGSVQLKTNNTNRFQVDSTGRIQMVTSNLLADGEGSNFNVSINGYVGVSSSLVAGVGSGAVALSINDGKGNANLTFNHHSGTPDVTGNSFRIETNVDSTTVGTMVFEGLSTTTAGVDVNLNMMAIMYADTGNMTIGGSLTQNSDLRIKKDLQIIPNALDKLKTLNGYIYTRTDRPMEFQQTGCVAQEVQAVLPEAVVVGEDEQQTLSIAYGSMVGLLVEAIKELEAKVAALESGA